MPLSKKKISLSLFIIFIAAAVSYIIFVPQTFSKKIEIHYPMLKTGEQISMPSNIIKWYFPFAVNNMKQAPEKISSTEIIAGSNSLLISNQTPISALLEAKNEKLRKKFFLRVDGDTSDTQLSLVELSYKNTFFNQWFRKDVLIKEAEKSLVNLKEFMEDTKRFYGYEIQMVKVEDTSFLFKTTRVPFAKKREGIRKLFEELIAYAEKKNAGYTGVRIFYSIEEEGELKLFASIGVTNSITPGSNESIEYKKMPLGKNLLVATFQGTMKEVDSVYKALEQFKRDHNLVSMAIPFQKFLSDGYDFAEEQVVQMKVYSPVF